MVDSVPYLNVDSFRSRTVHRVVYIYPFIRHLRRYNTGNIGQFPTWVKLGSNLGNNNSQLLKLGFSWGKVGFYFES